MGRFAELNRLTCCRIRENQDAVLTRQQIEAATARVDQTLARECVPIHARPLLAMTRIGSELGVTGFPLLNEQATSDYPTDNSHISPIMMSWFERRYGEQLKVDMSLGHVAMVLRGDVCPTGVSSCLSGLERR